MVVFLWFVVLYFFKNCDGTILINKPKSLIELHIHVPVYVINLNNPATPINNENNKNEECISSRILSGSKTQSVFQKKLSKKLAQGKFLNNEHSVDLTRRTAISAPVIHTKWFRPVLSKIPFSPIKHPQWKFVNSEHCGLNFENRIVGGVDAALGMFPWMAQIGYKNQTDTKITYRCGGVLISHKFVVTAAHCVLNLPLELEISQVRLGEYDTSKKIDCVEEQCADRPKDFDVLNYVAHQNYGVPLSSNDIALLQLKDSVPFTIWISPICLPYGSLLQKNLTGSKMDTAGWGLYESISPNASVILQTVKLPVINYNICKKKYRRYQINESKQLCVGGEIGKDSCSGDSGGPLMRVEAEGDIGPRYYLFGIVSIGATYCGLTTTPAIYTRVVYYLEWILNNMTN